MAPSTRPSSASLATSRPTASATWARVASITFAVVTIGLAPLPRTGFSTSTLVPICTHGSAVIHRLTSDAATR